MKIKIILGLLLYLSGYWLQAIHAAESWEVLDYKIVWDDSESVYRVYMTPSATPSPTDLSISGQVTIRVPNNNNEHFAVSDITSAISGVSWTLSSHIQAPAENSGYDYFSFIFSTNNAQNFNWQANTEQEIFNFKNSGTCTGEVAIMPNGDAFNQLPNSTNTNPGNQFTNLGWGSMTQNNFSGVYGGNTADCTPEEVVNKVLNSRVEWESNDNSYHVYMIPSETPSTDNSIQGRVTLKVPHIDGENAFNAVDIQSHVSGVTWSLEQQVNAPAEALNYDYLSFTFQASNSAAFSWEADVEQEVFSFRNLARCPGLVTLMENDDAFNQLPNSVNSEPANLFTNSGWGSSTTNQFNEIEGDGAACNIQGSSVSRGSDADNDGIPDAEERDADTDGDGIADSADYDPTGYFYCEGSGKIMSGGSISVSGPAIAQIIEDGNQGYYQFFVSTAGTYTMSITPPSDTEISQTRSAAVTVLDPSGQANPYSLGSGENADTGYLVDYSLSANPAWYTQFEIERLDPFIVNNNIPLTGTACEAYDNGSGDTVMQIPTLSQWFLLLLSLLMSYIGFKFSREKMG